MTSMTMHSQWTAPTMLSRWTEPTPKRTRLGQHLSTWAKVIDTTATVLCPLVVSASAMFAAAVWPAPAHADPVSSQVTDVLTNAAGANTGPIKTAIAELDQSLCPMLVRPGSTLATNAAQMQGKTGLTPAIAGVATGMAIQMECPALMTSIANGNLPMLLPLLNTKSTPAVPFQLPGANSATSSPIQLPKL